MSGLARATMKPNMTPTLRTRAASEALCWHRDEKTERMATWITGFLSAWARSRHAVMTVSRRLASSLE